VSKFINQFILHSRTTNLRNEISNFQQRFDESFHEAWDRYKDLLYACPRHGFTELHQLDTFYNALNPTDQDSLNVAAGGNLLERRTQDVLTIIENKSKCLAAGGNTFPELRDNIQGYIAAAIVNYNQGNAGYRPPGVANQIRPSVVPLSELEKIKRMNEANMKAMQTQINNVKNNLRNEMKNSIQASMSNKTNELKNMMANFFQMNIASTSGLRSLPSNTIANPKGELKAITTRSGIVLDGPFVPIPPLFINPEEDEPVILKKLLEKLRDPGKFLILCGFNELKCKTLADLGASINFMPLSVWKKLGLPEIISTRMTLKLANGAIFTPAGIAKDVFVSVGKFTFLADFFIVDYESDPRVPLILGRPFLRTARAMIDVYREEMILRDESIRMINIFNDSSEDFLENLFATNHQSGNPTFSSHAELTSPEVKDNIFDLKRGNVLIEKLLDLNSIKYLHPSHNVNPLSGSTTSSSPNHLLKEFADELALITFPSGNDDLPFDIESDLKEIEYLLNYDPIKKMDSILKDSIDQSNLADLNDNLVIPFQDVHRGTCS
nr:hypothetical protein [Tanacetum cinerariifolium]